MESGKIVLERVKQNREQWLSLREGKITSTAITCIAGLNPYKSALQLWAEWTGKVKNDFNGNEFTDLGLVLEPYVGSLYARRSGRQVREYDALIQHASLDWALATPDFIVDESELLEVKTGSSRQFAKWEDDETPENYAVQLQWQLGVCGIERGHIAALLGGDPTNLLMRSFELDHELFGSLLELGLDFLHKVKSDEPPAPGDKDSRLITSLINRNSSSKLFSYEQAGMVSEYFNELVALRDQRAQLESEVRRLEAQIKINENCLKLAAGESAEAAFADGRRYRVKRIEVAAKSVAAYQYERLYILNAGGE
ncbi:COG5377 Phage-related protein, predicted endonuclease [uncultured Caudovirales phage]|uniref:COG5377 Phage-related protein, predicted endonuclease n=1 Tax=uncultured Caudovirales phage TaxID=2100421 RepID=A0A6J5SYB9_9CAUD|nr:COG5377 Phage-related protein, predicted endonuclease [uncultured Caudovirales phage]